MSVAFLEGDPTLAALAKFNDESQWVIVRNVPVFEPHVRKGKNADGKDVVKYEVTEEDLPDIAANVQALEREKGVCPKLQVGHTDFHAREIDQVPVVGYVRNVRTGRFGQEQRPALLADLYYRKEDYASAKRHPFRSVEYYPNRKQFSAVALLTRDPELDLGMLTFGREEVAFCYMKGADDMPHDPNDKAPPAAPDKAAPGQAPDGAPPAAETVDENDPQYQMTYKYFKHMMGKEFPKLPEIQQKYQEATAGAPAAAPAPAAPAQPSGTNTMSPAPTTTPDKDKAEQMQRQETAELYALRDRVAQLESKDIEKDRKLLRAERKNELVRYQGMGYLIDPDELLDDQGLAEATQEQYARRVQWIVKNVPRRAGSGFIGSGPNRPDAPAQIGDSGPAQPTEEQNDQAFQYQRENPGWTYEQGLEEVFKKNGKQVA